MKNFYLICMTGVPNYGDELILKTWLNFINKKYTNCTIWVDTPQEFSLSASILSQNLEYNNIKIVSYFWNLRDLSVRNKISNRIFKKKSVDRIIKSANSRMDERFSQQRFDVDFFKNIESIHILGGGYLNSMWENNYSILIGCDYIKNKYNIPVYMTGAGLCPAVNNCRIRRVISNFDFKEARDEESAKIFDINKGFDDVYLGVIDEAYRYQSKHNQNVADVMISIQSGLVDSIVFKKVINIIREKVVKLKSEGLTVGYVEAIPGQDTTAYNYLSDLIDEGYYYTALESMINGLPIKDNQLWISSRFHHHLVASSRCVKGIILCFKPDYYDIKHNSLLKLGTNWAFFNAYTDKILPEPQESSKEFSKNLKSIISHKMKVADTLYR
ncbi:polysaccharide pyruvyl transferase family protein [Pseudomonas sp.]|uniref:polysaccharide pyruvyl transferase family protein n=1 Tax=Pseudomonas sp. TaxID=306 RepID=UPI0019937BB5|nr:polysaccharide pyruvyl transferase family protein [Pseudomonas sp.]MBC6627137.1 polysaccharide pyruvyl transferase family protein [Pseudomonas sp.]